MPIKKRTRQYGYNVGPPKYGPSTQWYINVSRQLAEQNKARAEGDPFIVEYGMVFLVDEHGNYIVDEHGNYIRLD